MVGGKVIEVCDVPDKPDRLWVNCADLPPGRKRIDTCSVLVEKNADSEQIQLGDSIWWQGGIVYWTPQHKRRVEVQLKKIGGSGVTYETASEPAEK